MSAVSAKIIMFDGPDGVGKTTQIERAAEELKEAGVKVYSTRINGGSPIGEELRKVYLSNVARPAATDHYLGMAIFEAFVSEMERLRPEYDVILVDRSPLSNVAYQAYGSSYSLEDSLRSCDAILAKLQPDLIICYDAPLEMLRERLGHAEGAKADYFESQPAEFFERVRQGYKFCSDRYNTTIIDASGDFATVHQTTMTVLESCIPSA